MPTSEPKALIYTEKKNIQSIKSTVSMQACATNKNLTESRLLVTMFSDSCD